MDISTEKKLSLFRTVLKKLVFYFSLTDMHTLAKSLLVNGDRLKLHSFRKG
jgi:hypothetical protein